MFKFIGFILIIIVSGAIGFSKSGELKIRCNKLSQLKKNIIKFKEHIRFSGKELDRLKAECFEESLDYSCLYKSDCEIIEKLFSEIALLDRESAYKLCELSYELLDQKYREAENKYTECSKLYKSIGVLTGIFICIFFI